MKTLIYICLVMFLGSRCSFLDSLDSSNTTKVTFSGRVFEKYTDLLIEGAHVDFKFTRSGAPQKSTVTDSLGYYEFKYNMNCTGTYYINAYRDSSTHTFTDIGGTEHTVYRDAYRLEGDGYIRIHDQATCSNIGHIEKDIYLVKIKYD